MRVVVALPILRVAKGWVIMMQKRRWTKAWTSAAVTGCLVLLAGAALGADDNARFVGTWKTSFPYNRQIVNMISIHDPGTFKNFVVTPTGNVPAGEGTFSAANGKWTAGAPAPNNVGIYKFLGDNTVVCTNAIGQTITWRRDTKAIHNGTPQPGQPQPGAAPAQPPTPARGGGKSSNEGPPESNNPATIRALAAFNRKDYNTAWHEFMTAAQQGDAEAQAGLGAMLMNHRNPPGTGYYAQAEQWFLASAKQNNIRGIQGLGQFYFAQGRNVAGGINPGINTAPIPPALQAQAEVSFRKAREAFERGAAMGDVYCMGNLAVMLDSGVGGPRDKARADELRSEVAKGPDKQFAKVVNNDPQGQAFKASWQAGHYDDALKGAQERANQGDAGAEALLGKAYYEGVGAPRDYSKALYWLNRSVAQNNADAMFILGLMYEHGRGVNQDIPRSVKLFDQAAAMGQGYARMEAAGMRMQGESNRVAAMAHHGGSEETACGVAGGTYSPGECIRGGETIDPFDSTHQ